MFPIKTPRQHLLLQQQPTNTIIMEAIGNMSLSDLLDKEIQDLPLALEMNDDDTLQTRDSLRHKAATGTTRRGGKKGSAPSEPEESSPSSSSSSSAMINHESSSTLGELLESLNASWMSAYDGDDEFLGGGGDHNSIDWTISEATVDSRVIARQRTQKPKSSRGSKKSQRKE
mmetsp:Transcript_26955/g.62022  ORF Transcript_26955/g.62022 Transcript_26955/m.62022 type:complete len:172 (-) Transcript_26955:175-690(-)